MNTILVYIHITMPISSNSNYIDTHMYLPCVKGDELNTIIHFNMYNDNMKIHSCSLDGEIRDVSELIEIAFK
jgi:hypothetical protein